MFFEILRTNFLKHRMFFFPFYVYELDIGRQVPFTLNDNSMLTEKRLQCRWGSWQAYICAVRAVLLFFPQGKVVWCVLFQMPLWTTASGKTDFPKNNFTDFHVFFIFIQNYPRFFVKNVKSCTIYIVVEFIDSSISLHRRHLCPKRKSHRRGRN